MSYNLPVNMIYLISYSLFILLVKIGPGLVNCRKTEMSASLLLPPTQPLGRIYFCSEFPLLLHPACSNYQHYSIERSSRKLKFT